MEYQVFQVKAKKAQNMRQIMANNKYSPLICQLVIFTSCCYIMAEDVKDLSCVVPFPQLNLYTAHPLSNVTYIYQFF